MTKPKDIRSQLEHLYVEVIAPVVASRERGGLNRRTRAKAPPAEQLDHMCELLAKLPHDVESNQFREKFRELEEIEFRLPDFRVHRATFRFYTGDDKSFTFFGWTDGVDIAGASDVLIECQHFDTFAKLVNNSKDDCRITVKPGSFALRYRSTDKSPTLLDTQGRIAAAGGDVVWGVQVAHDMGVEFVALGWKETV